MKLPEFWTSRPRVWFQQTEAQFVLRQVTADNTKYFYVVAALDQDSAQRVIDLLEDPPRDHKYLALKKRLLDTFDLSDNERAALLLNMPHLGDKKPSVLMDEMLAPVADHCPCFLFNHLFLQLLPDDIRMVLSGHQWNDSRQLAARIDELWLARSPAPPVSRISRPRKGANCGQDQQCSSRNQEKLCLSHFQRTLNRERWKRVRMNVAAHQEKEKDEKTGKIKAGEERRQVTDVKEATCCPSAVIQRAARQKCFV